ncbi:hypothetical protein H0A36_24235 [Endozoicomonas sp. SM1973]|uniref:Uncharacterized protein n=1 Tax=Spartinivicinus marinus TaxID=2994442 RepID=A0A853I741_9GAMM|nr:hypothetical protein [Spartinivicinus marinus]MCX4029285.1 hypothetical protein [Spartinivicinus marinus]NYZ69133.1 hypothetical protein [Spartinivicinus marinus]
MWSSQYYYFLIQSDDHYSEVIKSSRLIDFLTNELHLLQKGPDSFEVENHLPWLQVAIVNAQADGSFSTQNNCPEYVNIISIIKLAN